MSTLRFTTVDTGTLHVPKLFMLEFGEGMVDCPTPVNIIEQPLPRHG